MRCTSSLIINFCVFVAVFIKTCYILLIYPFCALPIKHEVNLRMSFVLSLFHGNKKNACENAHVFFFRGVGGGSYSYIGRL